MHDHVPRGGSFWNDVGQYLEERDLRWLQRDWKNDAKFLDVSIHVASCSRCLGIRKDMVESWEPPGSPGEVW